MRTFWLVAVVSLCLLLSCASQHERALVPLVPEPKDAPVSTENSFTDLSDGAKLAIVVPMLKGKDKRILFDEVSTEGQTITLKAPKVLGVQVSHYQAVGTDDGKVTLTFERAEAMVNGNNQPLATAPPLPFALPGPKRFVRLLFLVRVSSADHNMAILAADSKDELKRKTAMVQRDAGACKSDEFSACTWVPQSVAVRPIEE